MTAMSGAPASAPARRPPSSQGRPPSAKATKQWMDTIQSSMNYRMSDFLLGSMDSVAAATTTRSATILEASQSFVALPADQEADVAADTEDTPLPGAGAAGAASAQPSQRPSTTAAAGETASVRQTTTGSVRPAASAARSGAASALAPTPPAAPNGSAALRPKSYRAVRHQIGQMYVNAPRESPHLRAFPIEPKVMTPYAVLPGKTLRRIDVERRRRAYRRYDLVERRALCDEDVDLRLQTQLDRADGSGDAAPGSHAATASAAAAELDDHDQDHEATWGLALSLFDDESYEDRSPESWLQVDRTDDGSEPSSAELAQYATQDPLYGVPIAARARKPAGADGHGAGTWQPCLAICWSRSRQLWGIYWTSAEEEVRLATSSVLPAEMTVRSWLPRLDVNFLVEDPERFLQRIDVAVANRHQAIREITYELCLDHYALELQRSMPATVAAAAAAAGALAVEVPDLDGMLDRALARQEKLKPWLRPDVRSALSDEVVLSWHRANAAHVVGTFVEYTRPGPPLYTPACHRAAGEAVPSLQPTFPQRQQAFIFNSCLAKVEAIRTLTQFRAESRRILKSIKMFLVGSNKMTKIDEFETLQLTSITNSKAQLRDAWIPGLINVLRAGFREIDRGWYNLGENNYEVYQLSRLKRFMTCLRFMMEDSLRDHIFWSVQTFADWLQQADIEIHSVSHVAQYLRVGTTRVPWNRKPLLILDLTWRQGRLEWALSLDRIKQILMSFFNKALESVKGLPQLEALTLSNIFWNARPSLSTPELEEPSVAQLRDRLVTVVDTLLDPLQRYHEAWQTYVPQMASDIKTFHAEYAAQDRSLAEVEADVLHYQEQAAHLDRILPSAVQIGLFHISCEGPRQAARRDYHRVVLDVLAEKTRRAISQILATGNQIHTRLQQRCVKIEDVAALRTFIAEEYPVLIQTLENDLSLMQANVALLESHQYDLGAEEVKSMWRGRGLIGKAQILMTAAEAQTTVDETTFARQFDSDVEIYGERLKQISTGIQELARTADVDRSPEIVQEVRRLEVELQEAVNAAALINSRERLFGKPVTQYDEPARLQREFEPYAVIWTTIAEWQQSRANWLNGRFDQIKLEDVDRTLNNGHRQLTKWVKNLTSNATANGKPIPEIVIAGGQMRDEMGDFRVNVPLIQALCQPGMRTRHWDAMSKSLDMSLRLTPETTLSDLLRRGLLDKMKTITEHSEVAAKEYAIESALQKITSDWSSTNMQILPYKETKTYILKLADEVTSQLDDHLVLVQTMATSPFKAPFADALQEWQTRLSIMQDVVESWQACQRNWLYLETIFSAEDIAAQLPVETKRFTTVDRTWRRVMQQAYNNPKMIEMASDARLLDNLRESNKLLDLALKGLSAYLENKRLAFPRFFFLSDDELLAILSQTRNIAAVQPHLRKCFENMASLEFGASDTKDAMPIVAMFSNEGERVPFVAPFVASGPAEAWLALLEQEMKKAMREVVRQGLTTYASTPRTQWILEHPGQAVLAASQTFWTAEVELAIKNDNLPAYYRKLLDQLQDVVVLVRGDLQPLQRLVLGDLIVIDVHARDVIKRLIDDQTRSVDDFAWISQLRYYWEEVEGGEEDLFIKIVNARFRSGHEYLGNTGRLVVTPLTDRCYLTLTGAMNIGMGGAPAGPAGTGKTETVKDLAKALAKQCVVYNCSDQLDYLAMAKFFKGLAASGAWACFDEFNRIDIEVLSVISQQVMTIQKATVAKQSRFMFEGVDLQLDPTNAVFITMNPGYAGRTELPDNLKALFRPVAMMIPNYAMIGEISLFSFGFSEAKSLAQKMVATFKLASEQLSSQDHYDFGMRAVKTVISSAGNLKRAEPETAEDLLLIKALSDCNLPKFLSDDVPLFQGILEDLFPGRFLPNPDYSDLIQAVKDAAEQLNIIPAESFLLKCIQLFETTRVRHGLMLVGPVGGGKTCTTRALSIALTLLSQRRPGIYKAVTMHPMNPKSVTMGQLYGEFDVQTHEWTDGLFSVMMREGAMGSSFDEEDSESAVGVRRHWYIFDGPVDAVWVESMNTLLDDNKKLCLSSGEIIKMTPDQTIFFEVGDLAFASPATVSRCGMIYMEPTALGVQPLIDAWIQQLPIGKDDTTTRPLLQSLLTRWVPLALDAAATAVQIMPTRGQVLVQNVCRLITALRAQPLDADEDVSDAAKLDPAKVIATEVLFCLLWGIGGPMDNASRAKFLVFIDSQVHAQPDQYFVPPFQGSLNWFDFCFRRREGVWVPWTDTKPMPTIDPIQMHPSDVMIPTAETIRNSYWLQQCLSAGISVICPGPTGTGKTAVIREVLLSEPTFLPIFINFSARSTANGTQDVIDSRMEKRRKGIFGPVLGKRAIVFVDDLNMPQLDLCDAQPAVELLRQWQDYGGWYDRAQVASFKAIQSMSMITALQSGPGKNPVTERFTRHNVVLAFDEVTPTTMTAIYETMLSKFGVGFPSEIQNLVPRVVRATLELYCTIRDTCLPTPQKSHYTFNMRDVSRVFVGLLAVAPADLATGGEHSDVVAEFGRAWRHEGRRVFMDRLVDDTDINWFLEAQTDCYVKHFPPLPEPIDAGETILYGNYLIPGRDVKPYVAIRDLKRLEKLMDEYLDEYNSLHPNNKMKLVLFLDAIEHVSRICRTLSQPNGHALLLGIGGSGRQSLAKLAIFMQEYEPFTVELSKNYGQKEWRDDIRKLLMNAGVENKKVAFLLSDTQLVSDACLEDINNLLNGGDVPNLYAPEDMAVITSTMQKSSVAASEMSKDQLFNAYLSRIRKNMHVVFCMSPVGDAYRQRLRMFPSLINCTTMDWFRTWPTAALRSVAAAQIAEMNDFDETTFDGIVSLCVTMHETVREGCLQVRQRLGRTIFVTPKSYLDLLNAYKQMLSVKRQELMSLRQRTSGGLTKLLNAAEDVRLLQAELNEMQPVLLRTSEETERTMIQLTQDKGEAQVIREDVERNEQSAAKKAEETQLIADEARRELDEALPLLDAAVQSLNSLSKNDVIEVRSMQRPPDGVKLVIEAVCIIKQVKPKRVDAGPDKPGKKVDDYWDVGKSLMSDPGRFLESLMNFDKDGLAETTIDKLRPYIDNPDFATEVISRVSKAATSMCQWVRAMEKYYWVSRSVEPKRQRLATAQKELDQTMMVLNQLRDKMREADDKIRQMEDAFDEMTAKKGELSRKVEECNVKLDRADKLINGLASEKERWQTSISHFDERIKNIPGDVLLASGIVSYLGPFNAQYRQSLTAQWSKVMKELAIPHTSGLTGLWDVLGDPTKLRTWESNGLPRDVLSRENALISEQSRRWPLFIDPQNQANKWIRQTYNGTTGAALECIKLTDRDFVRTLENSIRFGKPVLLENLGQELDPVLDPILQQQTWRQNGSLVIKMGDSIIPYHQDFKFFMTTKLPNPVYPPEVCATVNIVNFTLSPDCLEDQLIALVVAHERPDLEETRNQLAVANAQMQRDLGDIEDRILYLLSSVQGSPVDDERLIDTLQASKATSNDIKAKVATAEQTTREIEEIRRQYVPVAVRTRVLFFCITELAAVDPMYQYSLVWFLNQFNAALHASEKADTILARVQSINDYFTFSLFTNTCRSLLGKHKTLFAFLLASRITMTDQPEDFSLSEYQWLLAGAPATVAAAVDSAGTLANPAPDWLHERQWRDMAALAYGLPEGFRDVLHEFVHHLPEWRHVLVASRDPQNEALPFPCNAFRKLLLIKTLRADKLVPAMRQWVADKLGQRFIEPQTSRLMDVYTESTAMTPIIFVLSAGADPAASLYALADELRMAKRFSAISLGQGQGPRAEALIREGVERGYWVFLQNAHLAPSWMATLDRMLEHLSPERVHRDFRLWLTSRPTDKFPVSVLQAGIKMTVEPPQGLKANLLRTYAGLASEQHVFGVDITAEKQRKYGQPLLFSLTLFHALVQERRKFGSLGWNIPYEFTDGDFQISQKQLGMFLHEQDSPPFDVLRYLVGEINYGGRVTDDWDRRLMRFMLADFLAPKVLESSHVLATIAMPPIGSETAVEGTSGKDLIRPYYDVVKELPLTEFTEVYHLHENANISFAVREGSVLCETLVTLQPGGSTGGAGGGGGQSDAVLRDMCLALQKDIPKPFPLDAWQKKYPLNYHDSNPMVLLQEAVRYNRLLRVIHSTLVDLVKALSGQILLSTTLEAVCQSFNVNAVPQLWQARAYPSLKPLAAWVSDLVKRCQFLQTWANQGPPPVFWISGFFFPQAFLTATLQNYARKHQLPIDSLAFDFIIKKEAWQDIAAAPQDGAIIRGLYLEGARWDATQNALAEARPKELYAPMSAIHLLPSPHKKPAVHNQDAPDGVYLCPVYKTLLRAGTLSTTGHSTNYILAIELPSTMPEAHWIKRGVALVTGLAY